MTRQMADDEVLRVLGLAILAARRGAHVSADDLAEARAAVAALQAERDALRAEVERAREYVAEADRRVSTMMRGSQEDHALRWQAESALEALRGQVAGLVAEWRSYEPSIYDADGGAKQDARWADADELAALLAIKERMG